MHVNSVCTRDNADAGPDIHEPTYVDAALASDNKNIVSDECVIADRHLAIAADLCRRYDAARTRDLVSSGPVQKRLQWIEAA
jgi:hypothetical protein